MVEHLAVHHRQREDHGQALGLDALEQGGGVEAAHDVQRSAGQRHRCGEAVQLRRVEQRHQCPDAVIGPEAQVHDRAGGFEVDPEVAPHDALRGGRRP
jgi:hypothetical protein